MSVQSYVWTFAWFADGRRIGKEIRVLAKSAGLTVMYFKIIKLMARPSGFPHAEPVILGREPSRARMQQYRLT